MGRLIAICDLDTFFVSVERLLEPSLIGKPVIVGGDPHGRGIVASCSYETRIFGVRSGMSARDAYRLCPSAIFVRGHGEYYAYYSRLVKEILSDFTPEVHPWSIDEFLCDFSGMENIYPSLRELCKRMREKVYLATGLPMSVGVGSNALVAKVASSVAKPDGFVIVPSGEEASFLAPLPVEKLPGVGPVVGEKLAEMGIRTIGDIARMPVHILSSHFGKIGEALHLKACGGWDVEAGNDMENNELSHHYSCRKSIGHESTFRDKSDPQEILAVLSSLCAEAGFRLRADALTTSLITVKLRYSDFNTVTMQERVHCLFADDDIYVEAKKLFEKLYTRRKPVRLIGVRLSRLQRNLHEVPLFEWEMRLKKKKLFGAIDDIRKEYDVASLVPLIASEPSSKVRR